MKLIYFILVLSFSFESFASMRVMSFNTTCSVCNKGKFDKFRHRKKWIVDTIKRVDPDLISLQEVLLSHQLRWFKRKFKNYKMVHYRKFFIFRYADPALFIRKDRFDINYWGGFWFGPRKGRFSLGWKKGFPRRLQYASIYDKKADFDFLFLGSHFDNASKNKERSAQMVVDRFNDVELPMILAADTNLKPADDGFKNLQTVFDDSFDYKEKLTFIKNSDTNPDDSCNLEKGKTFPECRVDHIMLSNKHRWRVLDWGVDQYKYGKKNRFTSDHRAIYADIELL